MSERARSVGNIRRISLTSTENTGVRVWRRRLGKYVRLKHPHTNGKPGRLHGEARRKLLLLLSGDVAGQPGSGCPVGCVKTEPVPMARFMRRCNCGRPRMSPGWKNQETPAQVHTRKMPKEGQTVMDGQTWREGYHATWEGKMSYF